MSRKRGTVDTSLRDFSRSLPMALMRTTEATFTELGVVNLSGEAQIQAIVETPILLTRPILVMGDQAVVARPVDRALKLLS